MQPLSPRMHQLVLTLNTRKPVCTAPTMADRAATPPPQEDQQQQHNPLAQEWQAAHEQIRDGHTALAAYYDRLSNLPPPGLQGTLQGIQRSLDGLRTDMLNIQQFLHSSDWNTVARVQNHQQVRHEHDPLRPLLSVLNGHVIPEFPATVAQINQLRPDQVDNILRHLGRSIDGTVRAKLGILRYMIGLTDEPV